MTVAALAAAREEARRSGEFDRADELREEIAAHGYAVEDRPEGTRVRKS